MSDEVGVCEVLYDEGVVLFRYGFSGLVREGLGGHSWFFCVGGAFLRGDEDSFFSGEGFFLFS